MPTLPSYEQIAKVLNVLSDPQALKMLNEAAKGFKSGKAHVKELQLNPRKYYRTLRELTDAGLTITLGNEYKLTSLGEFARILLLDELSSFLKTNQNTIHHLQEIGKPKELMVIDDYKKFISFIAYAIDKSKIDILLATRFVDFTILQSLSYALD